MFLAVPVAYVDGERHNPPYIQDDVSTVVKVIDGGPPEFDEIKYYKINFAGPGNIPSITAEVRIKPNTRSQVRTIELVELEAGGQVVGAGEVEV